MSPGFASDALKFSITVDLTRLMFPYMVFIGLMAIAMGVLNSYRHFAAPAIAPVFFNIAIILCIFAVAPFLDTPVYALAIGVLLGGFLQLFIQFPYLKKYGMTPKPRFHFRDEAIKKIFILMGPAAFRMGVYQLNNFVILWFSSHCRGSVSYLYYAGRLMELRSGSLASLYPPRSCRALSEHVAKKDWRVPLVALVRAPYRELRHHPRYCRAFCELPDNGSAVHAREFGAEASAGTAVALLLRARACACIDFKDTTSVFYSVKDTATPV